MGFGTGTIQGRQTTISKFFDNGGIRLSMTNGEGAEIKNGSEVSISGDNEVELRDTATDRPLGIVEIGGLDGEKVTVHIFGQRTLKVVAKSGAFVAGDLVKYTGTQDADGVPEYTAAATGNLIVAHVIVGALEDAVAEVVILHHVITAWKIQIYQ